MHSQSSMPFQATAVCCKGALTDMIYKQAHQNEERLKVNLANIAETI